MANFFTSSVWISFLVALGVTHAAFSGSFRPSWQDTTQPSSCVALTHSRLYE